MNKALVILFFGAVAVLSILILMSNESPFATTQAVETNQ